jgi:hypothetical protein
MPGSVCSASPGPGAAGHAHQMPHDGIAPNCRAVGASSAVVIKPTSVAAPATTRDPAGPVEPQILQHAIERGLLSRLNTKLRSALVILCHGPIGWQARSHANQADFGRKPPRTNRQ